MKRTRLNENDFRKLAKAAGGELIENNHMIVIENDEVVEKKYCLRCKEWHPITDFYRGNNTSDGLHTYCKRCSNGIACESQKNSRKRSVKDEIEQVDNTIKAYVGATSPAVTVRETVAEKTENTVKFDKTADAFSYIQEAIDSRDKEIARLQSELSELKRTKSLDNLSERDIKYVLDNNEIAPRLLFEAIAKIDGRYIFSAYDTTTGLTSTIKTQVA